MPQPRRASLWLFPSVLACVCLLTAVSLLLCQTASCPEVDLQVAQSPHLPMPPAVRLAADVSLYPSMDNETEDKPVAEQSKLPEPEPTGAASLEAAGKPAGEVITASAIEEQPIAELGPNLGGLPESSSPPQADTKPSVSLSVAEHAAAQTQAPPTATPAPPAADTAADPQKAASLPDWLRRLPELVASLPTISDPDPELATEATTTPAAAVPEPKPEPAAKPQSASDPAAEPKSATEPKVDDSWCEPETLIASLYELANSPAAKWGASVLRQIRALKPAIAADPDEAVLVLDRLDKLSQQTFALSAKHADRAFAHKWLEVGYALTRRVDIWRQVARLGKTEASDAAAPKFDSAKLADRLAKIEEVTGNSAEGRAWRTFLLVDDLKKLCGASPSKVERSRDVAAQALVRLMQTPLTPEQQRFVSSPPVTALRVELWRWAARPVGAADLLRDIERYERTRLPSDARRVAIDCQNLLASPVAARRRLADRVDMHYRNANFRFTVTEELLNDLIPAQKLEYAKVDGFVVGRPTRGDSLMETKIAVRMRPDPHHALLALEVTGRIAALTDTDAGMAQFHNESESTYVARKPLEINMQGISLWPVDINVENETRLNSVDTSVDAVPLIGWLARRIAEQQHNLNKSAATEEMKQKIVSQATERIDSEVRKRFSDVVDRLNQRVFDPLNWLALDPQLIDAETTEKRFTMRLRLGGEDQLGSHTPRPPAFSDSLASLQIHESVINNAIQRLHLDGRTFTLPELSRHVAASLNCPAPWAVTSDNEDVKITFAEQNSVVVRCQDGQVWLALSIARLSKAGRHWSNFQIKASYQPVVHGRSAQLAREDVIRLKGPRNMGSQMVLRGVFAHALSRKAPWELIPEKIVNQPKLQNAAITQFIIDDGWIGLAIGPKTTTTARRPHVVTR
jgi:hypothetical protein